MITVLAATAAATATTAVTATTATTAMTAATVVTATTATTATTINQIHKDIQQRTLAVETPKQHSITAKQKTAWKYKLFVAVLEVA